MTLIDTGPMVALIDKGQTDHRRCKAALKILTRPLLTTWPCITEAMHFLRALRGWGGQKTLWTLIEKDMIGVLSLFLKFHTIGESDADFKGLAALKF